MIAGIVASQLAGAGAATGPEWISSIASITAGTGAASSLAVQMPSSVDSGDLLVMHACNGGSRTFTTPSGWTALGSLASNGALCGSVFYKIASGSEGGTTVTLTPSSTCRMAAIVNRVQAGSFDVATPCERATPGTGSSSQPNSPSFAPSWGAAATLWFSSVAGNYVFPPHTVTSWPYAGGNTQIQHSSGSGGSLVMMRSCEAVVTTASEDPPIWAMGSGVNLWIAETIAVKPAP